MKTPNTSNVRFSTGITRAQFDMIRPRLEAARARTRPRLNDLYDVFRAVLYIAETGSSWRNLPPSFPNWRSVHTYFEQWTRPRADKPTLLAEVLLELGMPEMIGVVQGLRRNK